MQPPYPIYEECLYLAAAAGAHMMSEMAGHTRRSLMRRDDGRTPGIANAISLLDKYEPALRGALPGLLKTAFTSGGQADSSGGEDMLSLMDDTQLRESMEAARLRAAVAQRVSAALEELDPLISTARRLDTVRPRDNPLRPAVFLAAVRTAVSQTEVPVPVQTLWLRPMGDALNDALLLLYADLIALLKPNLPAAPVAAPETSVPVPGAPGAASPAATAQAPAEAQPAVPPAVPRRKLLLVDDDKAVVNYLAVKLGKHFDIASTTQPSSATLLARTERPDVILCDIDMPGMSGGEVAIALAADPRTAGIPLIYLTALATPQEIAELQGMVSGRPAVSKKAPLADLLRHINNAA